ncbi:MAG: aspartate dehydrogenase [Pseudomonadota bacterium]
MSQKLEIAVLGHGAIAGYVVDQVLNIPKISIAALLCRKGSQGRAEAFAVGRFPVYTSVGSLKSWPDLMVDCSGHSGLREHVPGALENGVDVISISTGALSDSGFAVKLEECARAGNASIRFLSGAVGGIDALTSGSVGDIASVTYTGRKSPLGWKGSPAEEKCDLGSLTEPFEHFRGTARQAARDYPKNANVAATIALASVGLDSVDVRLIADPYVDKNIHEIEASGEFGELFLRVQGNALPENPKSSALAAMSIVGELKRRISRIGI